jgi:hypothetical protein
MHSLQHIRRVASVLAGLAAALVAFGATPAFATLPPPEPAAASHPALSPWQVVGGYQGRFLGVVANLGCSWLVPSSHELGRGAVGQA